MGSGAGSVVGAGAGAARAELHVASHAFIASREPIVSSATTASPVMPMSHEAFVSTARTPSIGYAAPVVARERCAVSPWSHAMRDSAPSLAGAVVAAAYMMRAMQVEDTGAPKESAPVFVAAAAARDLGATTSG